jgi:pilus assembly protein Flp/PilA
VGLASEIEAWPEEWTLPSFEEDQKMKNYFRKMLKNEKGATAIEYGLIAALIAVAAITAMDGLGKQLNTTLTKVSSNMNK